MTKNESLFEELGAQWKSERNSKKTDTGSAAQLIATAQNKQLSSVKTHVTTIVILTITLIAIYAFYATIATFQESLSIKGCLLMAIALATRIGLEIFSLGLLLRIDFTQATSISNQRSIRFHRLRKSIHGPFMTFSLTAYIAGFFMLSPEFSVYLGKTTVALIDAGFVIGGVILIRYLHKIVQKEKQILVKMHALQEALEAKYS